MKKLTKALSVLLLSIMLLGSSACSLAPSDNPGEGTTEEPTTVSITPNELLNGFQNGWVEILLNDEKVYIGQNSKELYCKTSTLEAVYSKENQTYYTINNAVRTDLATYESADASPISTQLGEAFAPFIEGIKQLDDAKRTTTTAKIAEQLCAKYSFTDKNGNSYSFYKNNTNEMIMKMQASVKADGKTTKYSWSIESFVNGEIDLEKYISAIGSDQPSNPPIDDPTQPEDPTVEVKVDPFLISLFGFDSVLPTDLSVYTSGEVLGMAMLVNYNGKICCTGDFISKGFNFYSYGDEMYCAVEADHNIYKIENGKRKLANDFDLSSLDNPLGLNVLSEIDLSHAKTTAVTYKGISCTRYEITAPLDGINTQILVIVDDTTGLGLLTQCIKVGETIPYIFLEMLDISSTVNISEVTSLPIA